MKRIYLDYAATTPTHPDVIKVMMPYLDEKYGNPSSVHSFGQEAKSAVEDARAEIAALIRARPDEIYFTSGGTEADNFAMKGLAYAYQDKGKHIIVSAIEHHAVMEPAHFLEKQGFQVTYLGVDRHGLVDPEALRKALRKDTIIVSVMHANNEIGTIEPVKEIAAIAHEPGAVFHTDAVQTAGSLPVDVNDLKVDTLALSAHKIYGPKGVGALYIRKGTRIVPFMQGGGQEKRKRASTENVPGIVGLAKAAELAMSEMAARNQHCTTLRDRLIKGLFDRIKDIRLNGHPTLRLPNNVNIAVSRVEGEAMLLQMDQKGIAASSGSACTSGNLDPSHVLLACGLLHEEAHGSLRFTVGRLTTEPDIDYVIDVLPPIVEKLRAISPLK